MLQARRNDLTEPAVRMAEEAKLRPTKKWVLPVIWKFCELDITHDSFVSMLELLPMSAPLKRYEHCIGPFLQGCDTDDSGDLTLTEWGTCLKLDPEDLEDRCEALKQ
ncbi:hypothetical protein NP493_1304g00098 [Ridgeia piscesae]|uniref:SPARC/Testican calcium-binding domain-containing protein n=1 Tax=Ridgeia piscesae TaxID=27915 RepID=A0AAD9NE31_RIDPI|nr:hypothetical protein NP493_1304g00098 [Ridgeia piscesae]